MNMNDPTRTDMNDMQHQRYYTNEEEAAFLYHLAEISVDKLSQQNQPYTRGEPTLRRQLLIRNLLLSSSNLLITNQIVQEEQTWLDSCFNDLANEEEDEEDDEEEDDDEDVLMEDTNSIPTVSNITGMTENDAESINGGQGPLAPSPSSTPSVHDSSNLLLITFPFHYVTPSISDEKHIEDLHYTHTANSSKTTTNTDNHLFYVNL